ncbi:MAG: acyl-CoA dehydrogenase family protein, partial [Rhodospirillaceae bacterium]
KLMAIARSNNTTTGTLRATWRAAERHVNAMPCPNRDLQSRLALLEADIDGFEDLEARLLGGHPMLRPASCSSLLKLKATELRQKITELGLEAQPHDGLAQKQYLSTRAATIYSGTSEIHRNGLAHAIGCP